MFSFRGASTKKEVNASKTDEQPKSILKKPSANGEVESGLNGKVQLVGDLQIPLENEGINNKTSSTTIPQEKINVDKIFENVDDNREIYLILIVHGIGNVK
jgi:hypothetical protein